MTINDSLMLLPIIMQVTAKHCLKEVVVTKYMYKLCYDNLQFFNAATNISCTLHQNIKTLFERSCCHIYAQLCYDSFGIFKC